MVNRPRAKRRQATERARAGPEPTARLGGQVGKSKFMGVRSTETSLISGMNYVKGYVTSSSCKHLLGRGESIYGKFTGIDLVTERNHGVLWFFYFRRDSRAKNDLCRTYSHDVLGFPRA